MTELITYKDWSPTEFDRKGAWLPERGEWLVAPVLKTRDSDPLSRANFDAALERFGGEGDTIEVHRFGHWGPGWFEIILVHPDRQADVIAITDALLGYPVLDEERFSLYELEETDA